MKGVFALFLYLALQLPTNAQSIDSSGSYSTHLNKCYFLSYLCDTKTVLSAPFHASKKSWITTSCIAALGVTTLHFDKELNSFTQRNRTVFTDQVSSHFLEHLSNGVYSIPLNFAIVGLGYLTKNNKLESAGLETLKAMAIAGLLVTIPKYAFQRFRPFQDNPPDNFHFAGPFGSYSHNSFPSGHTCSAFAIAAVYSSYYKDQIYIPIIAYSLAGLSGLSRINDNKHWASDVLIGAALGYGVGKLVARKALHRAAKQIIRPN